MRRRWLSKSEFRLEIDSNLIHAVLTLLVWRIRERKAITLASATWAYLEELSKQGTHGTSAPGVAATLVEIGVREAIEKGYLKLRVADRENPVA